jgi:hypothetical protein
MRGCPSKLNLRIMTRPFTISQMLSRSIPRFFVTFMFFPSGV